LIELKQAVGNVENARKSRAGGNNATQDQESGGA
jgi:hypothetical protein